MSKFTLTEYTMPANGKRAYHAETVLGKYSVQQFEPDRWGAIQLFGFAGMIGGYGETPGAAVGAALVAGSNPVRTLNTA